MKTPPLQTAPQLQLGPGQHHLLSVAAGTLLIVEEGLLWVERPPGWVGEHPLTLHTQVDAGACHVVEKAGWIKLSAPRGARLRLLTEHEEREDSVLEVLLARMRCLRVLENRVLAAGVAALRLRLENREN